MRYAQNELKTAEICLNSAGTWQMRIQDVYEKFDQAFTTGQEVLPGEHSCQALTTQGQLCDAWAAIYTLSVLAPAPATQPDPRCSQWHHRVEMSVKISKFPVPDGILSVTGYSNVSEDEMHAGIQRFLNMHKIFKSSPTNHRDHRSEQHLLRKQNYANDYQGNYEAFYKHYVTQAEKDEDYDDAFNGHYLISLTKLMGTNFLLVRDMENYE